MAETIPRWESELWSYVSAGDGKLCPLISRCEVKRKRSWCVHIERARLLGYYDLIKPVSRCRMFQLVERLARGWQLRGRVCRLPVPSKLVYLADKHHPIEVRLLPLKVYHGAIWRLKEGWVIQLNENDPSYRKRFTLFHEAFHILAHCKTVPVFRNRRSDRGSFNEALADYFAACVLMPRVCVREKWAEVHDAERMAEIFDVSEIIMGIRLKELGLI